MHKTQKYINSIYPNAIKNKALLLKPINAASAGMLESCVKCDGKDYVYSSAVSVGEAIRGLCRGMTSWATVELYYAAFYSLRAILAFENVCIFYIGGTPYSLHSSAGSIPKKMKGTTHKAVFSTYKEFRAEPVLLSQQINLQCPLEWLMEKREDTNYKVSKFVEPEIPRHYCMALSSGIRRSINEYLTDNVMLYAFDPDHAMIAYPLKSLQIACDKLLKLGLPGYGDEEKVLLRSLFRDSNGPISELIRIFDGL